MDGRPLAVLGVRRPRQAVSYLGRDAAAVTRTWLAAVADTVTV